MAFASNVMGQTFSHPLLIFNYLGGLSDFCCAAPREGGFKGGGESGKGK